MTRIKKYNFVKILNKIILSILIIILIYTIYCKFVKREQLIKIFGKSCLIVTTGSMEPSIYPEEFIIISESNEYKKNDIVTYKDNDNYFITHRIIDISEKGFIAKGDANNVKDDLCDINQIQGKVIFHSRIFGIFVIYFLKPTIFIYLFIIFLIEFFKFLRIIK